MRIHSFVKGSSLARHGDSETGEVIGISLWESERALQATEEEANRLRAETAEVKPF